MNTDPIRPMQTSDIQAVVRLHSEAFPELFITSLGAGFLSELYRSILDDPDGMALVYQDGEQPGGFVAGMAQPSGFFGRLLRRRLGRFVLASIPALIKNPTIAPRLLRALKKPTETRGYAGCGLLFTLAVTPGQKNRGIGKALVQAFLQQAAARRLQKVVLTTDADDNEAANRFYRRLGFAYIRTYQTPQGRRVNEYMIDTGA
jgi:ribosomal protein S18 acetylase RimI-like enzyme